MWVRISQNTRNAVCVRVCVRVCAHEAREPNVKKPEHNNMLLAVDSAWTALRSYIKYIKQNETIQSAQTRVHTHTHKQRRRRGRRCTAANKWRQAPLATTNALQNQ